MAKVAIITDTHWGVRSDAPAFHEYFRKSHEWFFNVINGSGVTHLIHCGDLYDRRKYLNFVSAKAARQYFLEPLNSMGIESHILAGNHDEYYKNTHHINALDEVVGQRYPKIKVHTTPSLLNIDGLDLQLFPWITDSNRQESYDALRTSAAQIAFGHFEVKGFQLFKGVINDHGHDISDFAKFDAVYSGHFHHRSSNDNIHYIGGFTEHNWADYNDPRGFSIFDTNTREMEFFLNPLQMFKMILYDDTKNPDIVTSDLSEYRDTYVKVVITNKDSFLFDKFIDNLYQSVPTDITVVEDSTVFEESEDHEVDQAEDTSTILSKYIDSLKLPVDYDRMKKLMREVYQEAVSMGME